MQTFEVKDLLEKLDNYGNIVTCHSVTVNKL